MFSVGRWISNSSVENSSFNGNSVDIQMSKNRQASVLAVVMVLWSVAEYQKNSVQLVNFILYLNFIHLYSFVKQYSSMPLV